MWKRIGSKLPLILVVLVAAYGLTGCAKKSATSGRGAIVAQAQQAKQNGASTFELSSLIPEIQSDEEAMNGYGVYFLVDADMTTLTIDPSGADDNWGAQYNAESKLLGDINNFLTTADLTAANPVAVDLAKQAVTQLNGDMDDIEDSYSSP